MTSESTERILSKKQVTEICTTAFATWGTAGKRVLCIIPDSTRSCPLDMMFRVVYELLADAAETVDFLIALGTHPAMSKEAIYQRVGINRHEHERLYPKARFFNHDWRNPDQLRTVGTISEEEMSELSGGLMRVKADVSINKMVFDYEQLLVIGPTFPHEVVGFSGGNKYLFPGIAGEDIIHTFHWLGALITSSAIIGVKDTPVRRVINRSASLLPMEKYCLSMVVQGRSLVGLYAGTPEDASLEAADHSEKVHIVFKDKPYTQILSCAPLMYDDLWTGAKCMYKLEPVVADGGELIIYAPHIKEVSVTHGADIEAIGYHIRDYFVKQADAFRHVPGGVMAHSTHVKGSGTYEDGVEKPRINVTLATGISEEVCRKINLGYRDPDSINPGDFWDREDEGVLLVKKAGEMLYRLK